MQKKRKFKVGVEEKNLRLDLYLTQKDLGLSRAHIQTLIKAGQVIVNGSVRRSSYKVKISEEIVIVIPEPQKLEVKPEPISLHILYEDEYIIVVNKPVGMIVHPASGIYSGTLVNALLYHCDNLSGINGVLRPGIVHRLDKDTSGVLVVAKENVAHLGLAQQMQERKIEKKYIALVYNNFKERQGTINAPLGRHPVNRKKMSVLSKGKEAITHFKVLKQFADFALLEITPLTGRTHQIRVHLSYIKHPIIGDKVYGRKETENVGMKRQALHAYSLRFCHPWTGEYRKFTASLPADMEEFIQRLNKGREMILGEMFSI